MTRNAPSSTSTRNTSPVRLRWLALTAAAAALAVAAAPASAVVAYDESVSGDLSNLPASPTPIAFVLGDNIVAGTVGHDATGAVDRDYFTFTLGVGQALSGIIVLPGTQTLGLSFIGLESGSQITLLPTTSTAAGLLGWTHYSSGNNNNPSDINVNILPRMSTAANGSSGFGTLGAGTYSVWVQETSPGGAVPYLFNFAVVSVPEPSSWAMMLMGFGLIGVAFRRRRFGTLAKA
jgi:PEP-CTERM motif-containing protein